MSKGDFFRKVLKDTSLNALSSAAGAVVLRYSMFGPPNNNMAIINKEKNNRDSSSELSHVLSPRNTPFA